jgi:hypothetical protein
VCAQASRREAIIELLVLAFLILITMALLADCFVELTAAAVGEAMGHAHPVGGGLPLGQECGPYPTELEVKERVRLLHWQEPTHPWN